MATCRHRCGDGVSRYQARPIRQGPKLQVPCYTTTHYDCVSRDSIFVLVDPRAYTAYTMALAIEFDRSLGSRYRRVVCTYLSSSCCFLFSRRHNNQYNHHLPQLATPLPSVFSLSFFLCFCDSPSILTDLRSSRDASEEPRSTILLFPQVFSQPAKVPVCTEALDREYHYPAHLHSPSLSVQYSAVRSFHTQ
jgi:hypothetical protein